MTRIAHQGPDGVIRYAEHISGPIGRVLARIEPPEECERPNDLPGVKPPRNDKSIGRKAPPVAFRTKKRRGLGIAAQFANMNPRFLDDERAFGWMTGVAFVIVWAFIGALLWFGR